MAKIETPPAPDGDRLITVAGLGVHRDGRWLIRDVDLSVRRGEIVSIVGPNGGGKTTLVKTIVGIERPTTGSVERRRELTVGYVPQRLAIDPTMPLTVARLMTLTRHAHRRALVAALEETGVPHLLDAPVQRLSGGEFQRVLIARALLADPDLLVLDEPVQSVDFGGQVELYRLIADVRARRGCGVLLVSHDLHVVMRETDHVICLSGHVCCHGIPHDVSRHPEYLRMFGPRGAEALAVYPHEHDHSHGPSGEILPDGDACGHQHHHGHHHHHAGKV